MIIELFGLPGAGKTTFAKKTRESDGSFLIEYPLGRGKKAIKSIFKHPIMIFFWLKEILLETAKTKTWPLLRFKIALVMNAFGKLELAEKSIKDKVIVDEGLFQRILTVYETGKSISKLTRVIKKYIPKPQLLIIVESDLEKFKKYKNLKNIRARLGPEYLSRWLEAVNYNYKNAIKVIENLNIPHRYIKINSTL